MSNCVPNSQDFCITISLILLMLSLRNIIFCDANVRFYVAYISLILVLIDFFVFVKLLFGFLPVYHYMSIMAKKHLLAIDRQDCVVGR